MNEARTDKARVRMTTDEAGSSTDVARSTEDKVTTRKDETKMDKMTEEERVFPKVLGKLPPISPV